MNSTIHTGHCLEVIAEIPSSTIDAVITDPPYPHIKRDYGEWDSDEWWRLVVDGLIPEVKRVLKPSGSAVFILQPNSKHVGQLRGWLWDFMSWVCREWNMIQDVYWWNFTPFPTVHSQRRFGLMRPSVKPMIWAGDKDCYRKQDNVLWRESDDSKAGDLEDRALQYRPGGGTMRSGRALAVARERGGSTPMNLLPISNAASRSGSRGHSAGTPLPLAEWWTRYICPPEGTVLDPFCGAGTMGVAAILHRCNFIGIEKESEYCDIARDRIADAKQQPKLL
jgi:DNA modification methylase